MQYVSTSTNLSKHVQLHHPPRGIPKTASSQSHKQRFRKVKYQIRNKLKSSHYKFGQIESMNVPGVLHETGDADSRAHTRSQLQVEYFIIPYTSISIRLPHLCQGYHDHCVVTANDGGMGRLKGGSFMLGFGCGDREWVSFFNFFVLFFCCC